jgi:hypothetical protein
VLLLATYGVICGSIAARMPIDSLAAIDNFQVGPRYFFYPFILLAWLMIWLTAVSSRPGRIAIAAGFVRNSPDLSMTPARLGFSYYRGYGKCVQH